MDAVLQEIEQTEEGYVRDVEKLCSVFVAPLREEQALTKEEIDSPTSHCVACGRGTVYIAALCITRDAHLSI